MLGSQAKIPPIKGQPQGIAPTRTIYLVRAIFYGCPDFRFPALVKIEQC